MRLMSESRRRRRRTVRLSDAANIDRSADLPDATFGVPATGDDEREVILDPEAEDTPEGDDFWLAERPPHYS